MITVYMLHCGSDMLCSGYDCAGDVDPRTKRSSLNPKEAPDSRGAGECMHVATCCNHGSGWLVAHHSKE